MRLQTGLVWLATLIYPLVVYLGIGHFEPRRMALLLVALAVARATLTRDPVWIAAALGALLLATASIAANQLMPLKLYPALVNLVLLGVFGLSLIHPPSAIERIARLREPALPEHAIAYTRSVTIVWCAFFVCNGLIALVTALWATDAVWAAYNGLVAYLLMAALFAGEWLVRRRVQDAHRNG